jgi:hypothetical protein
MRSSPIANPYPSGPPGSLSSYDITTAGTVILDDDLGTMAGQGRMPRGGLPAGRAPTHD